MHGCVVVAAWTANIHTLIAVLEANAQSRPAVFRLQTLAAACMTAPQMEESGVFDRRTRDIEAKAAGHMLEAFLA